MGGRSPAPAAALLGELALAIACVAGGSLVFAAAIALGILPEATAAGGPASALRFVYAPLGLLLGAFFYRGLAGLLEGSNPTAQVAPVEPIFGPPLAPLPALGSAALHVVAAVLGAFVIGLLLAALGAPLTEQEMILTVVHGGPSLDLALLAFAALVAAPVAEELLFRGLLFRRLYAATGPGLAYAASALAFAVVHGNLAGFLVYAWLGLVFARAYARSGRLSAAIAAHFGNNAITLAILVQGSANSAP